MNYKETIRDVFKEYFKVDPDDAVMIESLGIDSLELVQLILDIEEKLTIDIDNKEIENLHTIGDVMNLARAKIRARGHVWPGCPSPGQDCTCGYSEVFWKDHDEHIFYK